MLKSFGFRTGDTIDGQNPAALEGWRIPCFFAKEMYASSGGELSTVLVQHLHPRSSTVRP